MTRRERLHAIYRGEVPDRPAVRLWRAQPDQDLLHPAYRPVLRAALELTEVVADYCPPFNLYCGRFELEYFQAQRKEGPSPNWEDVVITVAAPRGKLTSVFRDSTRKHPGYQVTYLLKEPQDIETLLTLPYESYPFSPDEYRKLDAQVGDAGIVLFNLDHAMYGLQRLVGSERFALWSLERMDLLMEAIRVFADRLRTHVEEVLATGLRPVFGWVGPELCIPPLMPPDAFEALVFDIDRPLIDLIHDAECRVWVHCHGRMRSILHRFAAMGVDVLNPVEPPPMGDITLPEAFAVVDRRMGLEGNIQTHDLLTKDHADLGALIHSAIDTGKEHRFILCPCSSYMEDPEPTMKLIDNLLFFVHEGVRAAEEAAKA